MEDRDRARASWYDIDKLNNVFAADNWTVTGHAKMPSDCGKRTGDPATVVVEDNYNVDPVQGEYDTFTATYYMAQLASGQYWFACIVENFTDTTYANGWAMSSGNWGKPSAQTTGKEVLIAGNVKTAQPLAALGRLGVLKFPLPALMRQRAHRLLKPADFIP